MFLPTMHKGSISHPRLYLLFFVYLIVNKGWYHLKFTTTLLGKDYASYCFVYPQSVLAHRMHSKFVEVLSPYLNYKHSQQGPLLPRIVLGSYSRFSNAGVYIF